MVMEASPGASFKMIQTQIVLGTLKVLFNVPARPAQLEARRFGKGPVKMGQVIVVGLRIIRRPIHHQPGFFQIPLRVAQPVLEKHFLPGQPFRRVVPSAAFQPQAFHWLGGMAARQFGNRRELGPSACAKYITTIAGVLFNFPWAA